MPIREYASPVIRIPEPPLVSEERTSFLTGVIPTAYIIPVKKAQKLAKNPLKSDETVEGRYALM